MGLLIVVLNLHLGSILVVIGGAQFHISGLQLL
jgi:hypothetical protein